MHWFEENILEIAAELAQAPVLPPGRKLLIEGTKGAGKSAFVDFLLMLMQENVFIVSRVNLRKNIVDPQDLIIEFLQQISISLPSEFKRFLLKFPRESRVYIRNKLEKLPQYQLDESDWYEEIFSQFLDHLGINNTPTFIFENIQNADSYQIEILDKFIEKFNYLPIQTIFTYDEEGPFQWDFDNCKRFILEKLSIQTTEKFIQEFYHTSTLNARLITNHLYLKTSGIPLKIRFLTNTVYRSILKNSDEEVVNIRNLQKIKISGDWNHIFQIVCDRMSENELTLLGFIAHLDSPLLESDLDLMCSTLKIPKDIIKIWQDAGFIRKVKLLGDRSAFMLDFREWESWLKTNLPIEKMEKILLKFSRFIKTGKITGNYQISHLLYDIERIKSALEMAGHEAGWLMEQSKLPQAADRLYFLVRMWDLNSRQVKDIDLILGRLSEIYLRLGAYENAFEILKRQRSQVLKLTKTKPTAAIHRKWINVNLRMAETLIAMDAFQEARYLIRESQIKKYCDLLSKGKCFDLTGDIESNLGHFDYARKNYHDAVNYYQQSNNAENILKIYKKLKLLHKDDRNSFIKLNKDTYSIIIRLTTKPDYLNGLLLDLLKLRMEEKNYQESLKLCIDLRRNLLQVYEPKIYFQLTLYLTEVYSQFGKWQLAISLIRRESNNLYVRHRPNLLVQALIQLGMLYKEQARYGEAKSVLEKGLKLSIQYHYQVQQYEIKLHLGHMYLLSHAMLRAYEYLQQAYLWASKEKSREVLLLANLYLSYYELQNMKIERSRKYLREAKKIINVSQNRIDNLNYLFYLGAWLYVAQRANHLRKVIDLMKKKSKNLPRYIATADYLLTKLNIYEQNFREAEKSFRSGQKIATNWNLPQIQYLLNCEMVRMYQQSGDKAKFLNGLKKTLKYLRKMKTNIQDEILSTQFIEARFHQDIMQWGEEHQINKIKE